MGVTREGTRARHRSLLTGSGGTAEVWLDHTSSRVVLQTAHKTARGGGSGSSNWDKCALPNCLGARLPNEPRCLGHAAPEIRASYYEWLLSRQTSPLLFTGMVIEQALWDEALHALTRGQPEVPIPVFCIASVFPFQLRLAAMRFSQHVSFHAASFDAGSEISQCRFSDLDLSYADFDDAVAVIRDCGIDRSLTASFVHMDRDRQHVAFVECDVGGEARFNGFSGDLRLDKCRISGDLILSEASVTHLSLVGSTLGGQLDAEDLNAGSIVGRHATFESAVTAGLVRVPFQLGGTADLADSK